MIWLRDQGYTVDKVERRLPHSLTTVDCFHFADVLALHPDHTGVLAVQATTGAHVQERVKKIEPLPTATLWMQCGNRLWVVGWALQGKQGARKLWVPKVVELPQGAAIESQAV